MLTHLGRLVARRPITVAIAWLVLAVVGYSLATTSVTGDSLFDRLSSGESAITGSESSRGAEILAAQATNGGDVTLLIDGVTPADADLVAVSTARTRITGLPGVSNVLDPFVLADGPNPDVAKNLVAKAGDGFLVIASLRPGLTDTQITSTEQAVAYQLTALGRRIVTGHPGATAHVGSRTLINESITAQAAHDLEIGELVALPIALLIMVLVFGGFLAAAMPLVGAIASIGVGLGALLGLSHLLDMHVTVVNVVACLGLGLSIDYGLLVVSRFREELALRGFSHATMPDDDVRSAVRDHPTAITDAVVRTVETAGRTVAFSALTIAASIGGLIIFRTPTLRSVGVASVCIVLVALLTSLTLVPALLRIAGHRVTSTALGRKFPLFGRVLRRTADVTPHDGVFSRLARRVQRRPWWVLGGSVLMLVVLALPLAGMNLRTSGIELLPASSPQRVFLSTLTEQYPAATAPQLRVVAESDLTGATTLAAAIEGLNGVAAVSGPSALGSYSVIGVRIIGADPGGPVATSVVEEIRTLSPGFETWTVSQAATQVETMDALRDGIWWAVAIVAIATILVLFAMTGSLILPLQALLTNALSLLAALGVLTWVFQSDTRAGWLDATSTGGIETSVVAIVVAFAFGLAMDYELFLVSRIVELREQGVPHNESIQHGLQQSGRIITSAAAIIIVVFAGFVLGQLLVIKQVGFALAVAVLIDATLVRMLLVPAVMTVLGRWNWWAPPPLVRLRERALGRSRTEVPTTALATSEPLP